MNKRGFTLAEVLISLGIVGVCAAILSPAIVNIMPDKNKTRVLQYYSAISNANVELLNDDEIYYRKLNYEKDSDNKEGIKFEYQEYDDNGNIVTIGGEEDPNADKVRLYIPEKRETETWTADDGTTREVNERLSRQCQGGLDCTQKSNSERYCPGANGAGKYASCLSDKLGLVNGQYKDNSTWSIDNNHLISITTPSGDTFKFQVDNWGGVTPEDALSKVYLKNVMRVNAKKDKEEAFGSQ